MTEANRELRIGLAQLALADGEVTENCRRIEAVGRAAREARCRLLICPELCDTGYDLARVAGLATWPDGAFAETLARVAAGGNMHVIAGVAERAGRSLYNSAVVVSPAGEVIVRYRKIHLYAPYGEADCFTPGAEPVCCDIDGWRTGLAICNDLRFPELARSLALAGAELLAIVSAWPFPRVGHWRTLIEARAIENQLYVAAANRVGRCGSLVFCGSSRLVDPHGALITAAPEALERLSVGDIERRVLEEVRARLPGIGTRRPEAYRL